MSVVVGAYSGAHLVVDGWCPTHARLLSYGEYRDGACRWCDPKRAPQFLANGKRPNPVHGMSAREVEVVLEDAKKFRRRADAEQDL